ncbi:MAG: GAF domain-containing protein [Anaerolineae bacterium]|nr:GAF domain-containing protein [Anaerolineae bacterium]
MNSKDLCRLRRFLPVIMLVVLLFGISGAGRLALSLGEPFPGLVLVPSKEIKVWTVLWSTPPHWPGIVAGMRSNDRILCIDDYRPTRSLAGDELDPRYQSIKCARGELPYADLFRMLYAQPGRTAKVLVDRNGTFTTVTNVPIVQFTAFMLFELFLPLFLFGLGLLTIGVIVYKADANEEINLIFTLFVTIAAGFAMDWIYVPRISDRLADALVVTLILNVPWIPLLGAVLFHWIGLLTGPGFLQSFARRARLPYYIVSAPFSALGILVYLTDYSQIDYQLTPVFYLFIMVSSVFSFCWGILSMGWTFCRSTSKRVRRQSGLILMGLVGSLAVVFPFVFLFTGATAPRYTHTVPFFGLAVVAFFGYAILRYQLFASKAQVLNTLLVAIFCILVGNLIYLILGQLTGFLPILAAALLAGIGLVARRGPTSFFTRLLRRETLDYQTVARFSQYVGELQQIESLLQAAFWVFQEDLDVEYAAVWLLDQERKTLERFDNGQPVSILPVPTAFVDHLLSHPEPIHTAKLADCGVMLDDPESKPVSVWAPLVDRGQAIGLLGLGPRWTGETYDELDLQLVGILARQMALSILNTRQFERLQATSHLIQQAQENERLKIARDLHDTIQQFLAGLPLYLETVKRSLDPTAGHEIGLLDDCQNQAQRASQDLRTIRQSLSPGPLKGRDLTTALRTLIDLLCARDPVRIALEIEGDVEDGLSSESKVALYRVVQQALDNVLVHAQGRQVTVTMRCENSRVRFAIVDEGCGFDVNQAMQARKGGHDGLWIMHDRIEMVGGELTIESAVGKGTTVQGWVPCTGSSESSGQ